MSVVITLPSLVTRGGRGPIPHAPVFLQSADKSEHEIYGIPSAEAMSQLYAIAQLHPGGKNSQGTDIYADQGMQNDRHERCGLSQWIVGATAATPLQPFLPSQIVFVVTL